MNFLNISMKTNCLTHFPFSQHTQRAGFLNGVSHFLFKVAQDIHRDDLSFIKWSSHLYQDVVSQQKGNTSPLASEGVSHWKS